MSKIVLEFPNDVYRQEWLGWWLDAGGEQDWWEFCDMHGINLSHKYPVDSNNKDKQIAAVNIINDAVIEFYEFEECPDCSMRQDECEC